jgi:hypothetical protein
VSTPYTLLPFQHDSAGAVAEQDAGVMVFPVDRPESTSAPITSAFLRRFQRRTAHRGINKAAAGSRDISRGAGGPQIFCTRQAVAGQENHRDSSDHHQIDIFTRTLAIVSAAAPASPDRRYIRLPAMPLTNPVRETIHSSEVSKLLQIGIGQHFIGDTSLYR